MPTTSRFAAFGVFLILSLWGVSAFACKCESSIKPVEGSKMVFWGKAIEIKPRGAQDRVKFEIDNLFKGDEGKESVLVNTNRFAHDCGFRFEVDKTYMVYAIDFYPRGVATSMCWGTHEAAEAPADEKWKEVKVDVPDDTKLEEALRKFANKVVPNCGAKYRLFDGGFSMVLSPDGDPARPLPTGDRASEKLDGFRDCIGDAFMENDDLPRPEVPVQIEGWYQRDVKQLPVLLDQLPCVDGCQDWVTRVKNGLLDADGPEITDQIAINLKAELEQCISGGIDAVGGESHGTENAKRRRDRMLAECAMQRGEFERAEPYISQINNETLVAAIKWATTTANAKAEGAKYPLRGGDLSFAASAIDGKPSAGKHRILRSGFFSDPLWVMSPAYLEAFAESILADEKAPGPMKDLASLAYERAALLMPDAADAYRKLADGASSSPEAKQMRDQLAAEHTKVAAPVVEEVAEEAPVEEAPVQEVQEAESPKQDPMLLVVAGILIVVAVAGIGTIMKKRR